MFEWTWCVQSYRLINTASRVIELCCIFLTECDGFDDVYGHSVEDDCCISPSDGKTYKQFRKDIHSMNITVHFLLCKSDVPGILWLCHIVALTLQLSVGIVCVHAHVCAKQ
jgi:hypothetical protein